MLHLEKHQISYFKHFKRSMYFAFKAGFASVVFIIHAIVPELFTETGSCIIKDLSKEFEE